MGRGTKQRIGAMFNVPTRSSVRAMLTSVIIVLHACISNRRNVPDKGWMRPHSRAHRCAGACAVRKGRSAEGQGDRGACSMSRRCP